MERNRCKNWSAHFALPAVARAPTKLDCLGDGLAMNLEQLQRENKRVASRNLGGSATGVAVSEAGGNVDLPPIAAGAAAGLDQANL